MSENETNSRNTRSWRKQLIWQLPLLALVSYAGSLVSNSFAEEMDSFMPETISNCSTHNRQASGYKAFYELIQRLKPACRRFEFSYRELPKEKSVLVIVAPTDLMMPYDIDKILNWVAEGNSLVYLDYCMYGSGRHMLEKLKLKPTSGRTLEDKEISSLPDIPEMEHVSKIVATTETRLSGGRVILSESAAHKDALLVEVEHGKGKCLVGTLPNLCNNQRISDKNNWGNFQFLANWLLARQAVILFDERVHGYSNNLNYFVHLLRGPVGPITLQLLFLFAICLGSLNQRFGPAKSVLQARKISTAEYIDGMAMTYEKARAYNTALSIIYGSFRTRLCKSLALAPGESAETLASTWAGSVSIKYEDALAFLRNADKILESNQTSEKQLIAIIEDCNRFYEYSKHGLALQKTQGLGV